MRSIRPLSVFFALLASVAPAESQQALELRDRDHALVYEVGFQRGVLTYVERSTATAERHTFRSTIVPSGTRPFRDFWNTAVRRGDRTFHAASTTAEYAHADVASTGDATVWVFRPAASGTISAVALGLRSPESARGSGGPPNPGSATFTIPARHVARAAMIFARTRDTVRIEFERHGSIKGHDEVAAFWEIARNETSAPITVTVSGTMDVNSPVPGGRNNLIFVSRPAGPNVTLLLGRLPSQAAFAAAVITSPLR